MFQPVVGLGTLGLKESAEAAIGKAAELGCALVDTGEHYGNLKMIGSALAKLDAKPPLVLKLSGLPAGPYDAVKARVEGMRRELGLDETDKPICLMHWPGLCTWDPADAAPLASPGDFKGRASSWEDFCANIQAAWTNMQKLKEDGLCADIGTSNFYAQHLEKLAELCDGAVPCANEIFIDLTTPEFEFVESMQKQNIRILAYRPVAYKPYPEPAKNIAERLGVGASQQGIILAWLLRRGVCPLVKCRGGHLAENFTAPASIKDRLTEADMQELGGCQTAFCPEWFAMIWRSHGKAAFSEAEVSQLIDMGVEDEKARRLLEKCGGDMSLAMEEAFD